MKDQPNQSDFKNIPLLIITQLNRMLETDIFSKDFFINHWKKVLTITIIAFLYISNRYSCEKKLAEIERLSFELMDKRFEALTRSSDLIGISRPSQVKELVRKNGIAIEESDKPAYTLND